ncbi:MAG: TIGR00730 family Rossman fold protein [Acidobacteria bacterium]|nr:TIGR00730 family Rossman fold protein [Acidobacteriota bacterium]
MNEPSSAVESTIRRIAVYCGSSNGGRTEYVEQARATGRVLAQRNVGLVYGGGGLGLMGACAAAALEQGGEVIGVIPHSLAGKERLNELVTDLRVVRTMHERKTLMVELADAFLALPGGFGTFDELFEAVTWAQLGIHQKPIGLLNVAGYFDPLLTMVERAIAEGFVQPRYRRLIHTATEIETLLDAFARHEPLPGLVQWLDLSES